LLDKFQKFGYPPILLTSATVRPYFYRLINSSFPDLSVLSFTELPANIELEFLGKLEVQNAN
jgi:flagellar biosynthesis protein FlhA